MPEKLVTETVEHKIVTARAQARAPEKTPKPQIETQCSNPLSIVEMSWHSVLSGLWGFIAMIVCWKLYQSKFHFRHRNVASRKWVIMHARRRSLGSRHGLRMSTEPRIEHYGELASPSPLPSPILGQGYMFGTTGLLPY